MPKTTDKRAPRRRAAKAGKAGTPTLRPTGLTSAGSTLSSQAPASPAALSSSAGSATAALSSSAVSATAALSSSAVSATATGSAVSVAGSGPVGVGQIPPQVFAIKSLTSLFDPARRGRAVVRPNDLLALRIELVNMQVQTGPPPLLKRGPASGGASCIVLHFPPQALAEQVFFQAAVPGTQAPRVPQGAPPPSSPGANENPLPPPIRARIAGESRLVFKVPDGFSVPYQLADVLAACEQLATSVPANALPRSSGLTRVSAIKISAAALNKLHVGQRAALSTFALRSLSVEAAEGADSPVLQSRVTQASSRLGLKLKDQNMALLRL